MAQLETIIMQIKKKAVITKTPSYLKKTNEQCMAVLGSLLGELSLGYRFTRMLREDNELNLERVYTLACRAHKLFRARSELVSIFEQILRFERELPHAKQQIMTHLQRSSRKAIEEGREDRSAVRAELAELSASLKALISSLVVAIPSLLHNFKFFNNSFVYCDRDYLKYLSKETNELKALLSTYEIPF